MAGHPLAGGLSRSRLGHGWPALHGSWSWLAALLLATFAAKMQQERIERFYVIQSHHTEIIYPCIPDPDREDERGQTSSSLAVSTRWISTAKLLQSGLATLAQREGGE
ncbi:hypothetical protein GW17_00052253 [Ensete ventricosum]|nr:hypothetical protein GW17_00052253 [Ensete ventricosum]